MIIFRRVKLKLKLHTVVSRLTVFNQNCTRTTYDSVCVDFFIEVNLNAAERQSGDRWLTS